MKIIQISDLHGHTAFIDTIHDVIAGVDLVILSGDITNFSGRAKAEEVITSILRYQPQILAVPGNCDRNSVGEYLREVGISIDRGCKLIGGYTVCGMGGSLPCPGRTPNEYAEADFKIELDALAPGEPEKAIYVIHQPPADTMLDRIGNGNHVGSKSVRNFLESSSALLCLTGHIHESAGIDNLGSTTIVNPGPAMHGNYAIVEVANDEVEAQLACRRP